MPTFFRVADDGHRLFFGNIEHIGWTDVGTDTAGITFFGIDDGRHDYLLDSVLMKNFNYKILTIIKAGHANPYALGRFLFGW